jgi:hypothetical protein
MGIITDRKSPRLAAIIGMFALLVGYYPIKLGTIDIGFTQAALTGGSI